MIGVNTSCGSLDSKGRDFFWRMKSIKPERRKVRFLEKSMA